MKTLTKIHSVVSAAMVAAAMLVVPASAHPAPVVFDCQGTATVTADGGLNLTEDKPFTFDITVDCDTDGDRDTVEATLTASGSGNGRCGKSTASGSGTVDFGDHQVEVTFSWTSGGSVLVVTGTHGHDGEGTLAATVQASGGDKCVTGADRFDVVIAGTLA